MAYQKTVCVDLDGVLAQYDGWKGIDHFGDPVPGAKEFLEKLRKFARVVIYSVRCKADLPGRTDDSDALCARVLAWLHKHELPYDEVYSGNGKPIAAAYIDDRAVVCKPQTGDYSTSFDAALTNAFILCDGEH